MIANAPSQAGMALLARLRLVLDLEEAQGFANRSTPWGMRKLGISWAHAAQTTGLATDAIETVAELLGLYDDCEHLRPSLHRHLRGWCEGSARSGADLDAEEEEDELHAAMNDRHAGRDLVAADAGLDDPVTAVRGVGPAMAERLAQMDVHTLGDLLFFFPRRYQMFDNLQLSELEPGRAVSVMGRVVTGSKARFRYGKHVGKTGIRARIVDGSGEAELIWWNQWVFNAVDEGALYHIYGQVEQRGTRCFINNPQMQPIDGRTVRQNLDLAARGHMPRHTCFPIYRLSAGLTNGFVRKLVDGLLDARLHQNLNDPLSGDLRQRYDLPSLWMTLKMLHQPADEEEWIRARRRMAFQELYDMHDRIRAGRKAWLERQAPRIVAPPTFIAEYAASLPFQLTDEQQRAVIEILDDLGDDVPARRILRGEAGSGKTAVVAAAMILTADLGFQAVMIAPTQLLARQHRNTLDALVRGMKGDRALNPVQVDLLAGSQPQAEQSEVRTRLANGQSRIVVGTTALVQSQVRFHRLGLLVVDEEHRFGVNQRESVADGLHGAAESLTPHLISMSATPIPRSLNRILTGFADVSEIRSRPAGRLPIRTLLRRPEDRRQVHRHLRRQVAEGRQACIVYPRIDADRHEVSVGAVETEFEWLARDVFPDLRLAKLHGRMDQPETDAAMEGFRQGSIDVLVATSVIEVGIDVPNATLMLIENAERYGLAQLHQLRSRVGRGNHPGTCVLICGTREPESRERLELLTSLDNGFEIAEHDLKQRGAGELMGTRQTGLPDLDRAAWIDNQVVEWIAREFPEPDKSDSSVQPAIPF